MREYLSVHDAHCCPIHGCKYRDEKCPVVLGTEPGVECEICYENSKRSLTDREVRIKEFIENWGMVDGAHHKQWVIDQIMRILLDTEYDKWLIGYQEYTEDDDGGYNEYEWDEGVAP